MYQVCLQIKALTVKQGLSAANRHTCFFVHILQKKNKTFYPTILQKPFPSVWLGQLKSHALSSTNNTPQGKVIYEINEVWVSKPFTGKVVGLPRVVKSKQDTLLKLAMRLNSFESWALWRKSGHLKKTRALSGEGMGAMEAEEVNSCPCQSRVLVQQNLLPAEYFCDLFLKKGYTTVENSMSVPQKIKNRTTIWLNNSISEYTSRRIKSRISISISCS